MDDFFAKNNTTCRILSKVPAASSSYLVLTREQIGRRARTTGPTRHIELSNVGFDKARTRAIVYREHVCGGECGDGGDLFLEKHGGEWRLVNPIGVTDCGWIA